MTSKKISFVSDRAASLQALCEFMTGVAEYGHRRNRVESGHSHVSRLSAAVRARLISEYEVAEWAQKDHTFEQVEKFVQEVYWRLYWKGWLEWHPDVWSEYEIELSRIRATLTDAHRRAWDRVEQGESGVKIMDRFAQELVATGYLHNHARMWFAGYWIHVCGLPWQLGADFFYRHLLDADPASNTLSWRWVAGLQTQGKTYLPRAGNIRKYCSYPEAGDRRLEEQLMVLPAGEVTYSKPQRNEAWQRTEVPSLHDPYLLWIHGEDLSFWEHEINLPEMEPVAAVMVRDPAMTADYAISPSRVQFMQHAMHDAKHRWEVTRSPQVVEATGSIIESIVHAAKSRQVAVVAGMLPAVGPLRNLVPELERELQAQGIRLVLWRRPQDETILPLAQKGFFPFWKSVRAQLV
ncbi:MAG: hypothetical protein KTR33_16010 [Gammaproteobacteria bacterium]|nr:hypothetical protein [Gammaproteobacteria bacterium]